MIKIFKFLIILLLLSIPVFVYASKGCCSNHGGQDYCDNITGKWVCKDGDLSQSCYCSISNPNNYTNKKETSFERITDKNYEEDEEKESKKDYLLSILNIIKTIGIISISTFTILGFCDLLSYKK